jgi:hypothetical protein
MEMPSVKNPIRDASKNITYVVVAYRTLSVAERTQMVRLHLSRLKKKPAKNSAVIIMTTIGFDDPL